MSNINVSGLDTTYPVAGRDNDSQGFRDNYAVIKQALEVAKSEITELETTSLRFNGDNTLAGSISGGEYRNSLLNTVTERGLTSVQYSSELITSIVSVKASDSQIREINLASPSVRAVITDWAIENDDLTSQVSRSLTFVVHNPQTFASTFTVDVNSGNNCIVNELMPIIGQISESDPATVVMEIGPTTSFVLRLTTYNRGRTVYIEQLGRYPYNV